MIQKKRLLLLADFLDNLPEEKAEHFHMSCWYWNHAANQGNRPKHIVRPKDLKHCGTSACALGWATLMPAFKNLGVRLRADGSFKVGRNKGWGHEASKRLFGLSYDDHLHLFEHWTGSASTDSKAWAARCREFVAAR